MPSIVVKYSTNPPSMITVQGTSIAIVAVSGGEYRHNDKPLDSLAFDLDAAVSCTVSVSPATGSMPAQTCFSGASPSQALPFTADWNMTSTTLGVLTLTIPSAGTVAYLARLQVTNGARVNISVKH